MRPFFGELTLNNEAPLLFWVLLCVLAVCAALLAKIALQHLLSSDERPQNTKGPITISCSGGRATACGVGDLVPASRMGKPVELNPRPTLTLSGGQLILSDSPEQVTNTTPLPSALYRDTVGGVFRVCYHHQNIAEKTVMVGVAIKNTTTAPLFVYAHGIGAGVSVYPNYAGQVAVSDFLATRNTPRPVCVLQPGQVYYACEKNPKDDTVSAMKEYWLAAPPAGSALTPLQAMDLLMTCEDQIVSGLFPSLPGGLAYGSAQVTTVVFDAAAPAPSDPSVLTILPGDTDHVRATFPHYDALGSFTVDARLGVQSLSVDSSAPGQPWSDPMPGEYELGVDAVDGGVKVYNNGNYGLIYRFTVLIVGRHAMFPFMMDPMALLMQPTGGPGTFVMNINNVNVLSPYYDGDKAWWFYNESSQGNGVTLQLQTSLTGGSSGPQKLIFFPNFTKVEQKRTAGQ